MTTVKARPAFEQTVAMRRHPLTARVYQDLFTQCGFKNIMQACRFLSVDRKSYYRWSTGEALPYVAHWFRLFAAVYWAKVEGASLRDMMEPPAEMVRESLYRYLTQRRDNVYRGKLHVLRLVKDDIDDDFYAEEPLTKRQAAHLAELFLWRLYGYPLDFIFYVDWKNRFLEWRDGHVAMPREHRPSGRYLPADPLQLCGTAGEESPFTVVRAAPTTARDLVAAGARLRRRGASGRRRSGGRDA